jgi:hypothetical protein
VIFEVVELLAPLILGLVDWVFHGNLLFGANVHRVLPNIKSMSEKFPNDEFAAAPSHGGRHRRIRTGRNRAAEFLKLALVSAVLATVAMVGIKMADSVNLFNAEPSAPATIAILDGTTSDLSSSVATKLVDAGYEVASSGKLVDATDPTKVTATTLVYAQDSTYLDKANAVAKLIGAGEASVISASTSPITVVIGTDYRN